MKNCRLNIADCGLRTGGWGLLVLFAGFWYSQAAWAGEGVKTNEGSTVSTNRNPGSGGSRPVANEVAFTGTVRWQTLEGGFFGLVAEDGKKYLPMKLDKAFQINGLRVAVTARIRRDVMSFRMWGENIEILSIRKTDP